MFDLNLNNYHNRQKQAKTLKNRHLKKKIYIYIYIFIPLAFIIYITLGCIKVNCRIYFVMPGEDMYTFYK